MIEFNDGNETNVSHTFLWHGEHNVAARLSIMIHVPRVANSRAPLGDTFVGKVQ